MANHPCPLTNHEWWKELVEKVGIFEAYKAFRNNGYELPDPKNYSYVPDSRTNYALKVVGVLLTDKVQKLYDKFYKNNPEKFYSELVPLTGKQQVDILRDYNNRNSPTSLQDMLTGIMAEMSYTVEINTAKSKDIRSGYEAQWGITDADKTDEDYQKGEERPTQYYSNLTVPGGINYTENEIATPGITPSIKGHAQFSTDQGIGWFRSDEKTVDDTPEIIKNGFKVVYGDSIAKYADSASDANKIAEELTKSTGIQHTVYRSAKYKSTAYKKLPATKTRRILELQSDFAQKIRNNFTINGKNYTRHKDSTGSWVYNTDKKTHDEAFEKFLDKGDLVHLDKNKLLERTLSNRDEIGNSLSGDYHIGDKVIYKGNLYTVNSSDYHYEEGWLYTIVDGNGEPEFNISYGELSLPTLREDKGSYEQSRFLALLLKEDNWIPFFIKTIIQDSAKKQYEKVLFPTGDTASKIEGHETLEQFKEQKQKQIDNLTYDTSRMQSSIDNPESKLKDGAYYDEATLVSRKDKNRFVEAVAGYLEDKNREIKQLQEELKRVDSEGIAALKPIYNFYENRVYRELEKMYSKEGISRIKDEYGNSWYEVEIVPEVDKSTIYLQKEASTELPVEELDSKVKSFLKSIGVSVKNIPEGEFAGRVDTINKIIEVVDGKAGIDTLSHEATHMFLDMLPDNSPILKEILDDVVTRPEYVDIYEQYKDDPEYQIDGEVDEEKIAKEAASHIIDDIIVGKFKEKAALKWWQKLWNWIKSKFSGKKLDAYEQVAEDVLSGYTGRLDKNKVGKGIYKQIPVDVAAKMQKQRDRLKKEVTEYAKALKDKDSTSTEQKDVISSIVLKEDTNSKLGLRPSPKVELEDKTHIYTDESGIVYNSTTKKITGEFSADKAAQYELNKDVGNDIDALGTAAVLGKSFDDIKKLITPTLPDDYKYRIYGDMLKFVDTITSNGEIAIPQVVVSDPVSKTAGSIDIYTIDRNGNQRVYDVKSSINEVKEGRSDTYLSEWQQNPGSVFNGLTYKDGEMVVRQEGDEPVRLSKKLQHSIQTGSYSRMLELQGGPVVGLYSKHFNVELDHVNWKIKSYKDEGLISHGIEDNKPYIDQVVPTQVDENNLSELQKNRIGYDIVDSDSPTDEEKKEAKEEFQQPLEGTPEIKGLSNKIHEFLGQRIEHIKRLLRNKPDNIHIFKEKELLALEDIRTVVGAAIDKEAYSSLLNTYMDYTINQANNTSKFLKSKMYEEDGSLNPKYLDVTRMASAFLEGYRDIADIMASIPDTQIPKFENMMKALKAMEDAIYTGNIEYLIEDTKKGGYQYTTKEIEEAYRGGAKDISVLARNALGPSATSSVMVSVFFDTVRKAIFTAVDQSKEDAAILDNALRDLRIAFPNTSDEKITDYIINKSDMTIVQRVGKEYEDMKQAAKDALINPDTGERYEYRIGNDKETLEYNKELHDKVSRYSQLTQAEKWIPAEWDPVTERVIADGYYEEGEYCEYAPVNVYDSDGNITKVLDYKIAREYNERKNSKGKWEMKGSADNGATIKWKEEKGIFYHTKEDGSLGERLSAKEKLDVEAFWYRSTYMMAIPDKYTPEYENGEFTGKVIANPEGTIKWVVKGEFKQVRDKSLSGKDLRDPRYVAIMEDNSPKGRAQRSFYNTYMDLRHKLSLKLPKAQRKNFMKYVDAVPVDTLAEAYRTGGIKKMTEVMSKQGKKFADISSEPAREVELDEKGDVIQGIPLPIIGRYNERRVKELSDELKAATTPTEKRRLKKLLEREKAKVKPQDISTDIVHNTKKVSNSIREYDNMSKAESKLLAIQQVANSKISRKKVPMTDAEGQNIFVKTVKGVLGKIIAMTDNNGYTNEAGMIRDMMNMLVNKDVPYKDTTAAKIEGLLITLLSLRYFAFNPPIALMGRMGNRFLVTWPEGVIGEYFTKKQVVQAEKEIQKSIALWSKNRAMQLAGGGTKFASKLEAWADKFQLHPGSHFSDKTLKSSPQHFTEWASLMAYAMPIGMNTSIKGQDGTISNLWNIFTFDSNTGELKIDKNFEKVFNDQNFKYKLFTKVFDFQNRYEGFYNKMEAFTITQYPGGRSLAFLKKHLPSIVQRIGAAPWVHMNLGYSEGAYHYLWSLCRDMKEFEGTFREKAQMGYREIIPKGAIGNKNYWKMNEEERKKADDNAYAEDKEFQNADGTINEEKVERDRQKRRSNLNNLKRIIGHVVSVCVFTGAYLLFKALAEDDETEARRWNNYLARTFDKLRKQQMFSIPLAGFEEQYQLLKSPIASLRVVGDFADTMGDAIGLAIPGVESRYTTGVHAGEYKAWVKTKKMVPVLNLDPYLDELNSANYYIR